MNLLLRFLIFVPVILSSAVAGAEIFPIYHFQYTDVHLKGPVGIVLFHEKGKFYARYFRGPDKDSETIEIDRRTFEYVHLDAMDKEKIFSGRQDMKNIRFTAQKFLALNVSMEKKKFTALVALDRPIENRRDKAIYRWFNFIHRMVYPQVSMKFHYTAQVRAELVEHFP